MIQVRTVRACEHFVAHLQVHQGKMQVIDKRIFYGSYYPARMKGWLEKRQPSDEVKELF